MRTSPRTVLVTFRGGLMDGCRRRFPLPPPPEWWVPRQIDEAALLALVTYAAWPRVTCERYSLQRLDSGRLVYQYDGVYP